MFMMKYILLNSNIFLFYKIVQSRSKMSSAVFEWLKQDSCQNHYKTGKIAAKTIIKLDILNGPLS